ncbi:MAG: plastocyanin/azurin family copper-binding protein, partial [Gemmatimonadaceae bacterium]
GFGAALLSAGVIALVSCVSERTTVTGVDANACDVQLPVSAFGSTVVVIRDFAFSPSQIRIRPGTRVTWVNCGAAGSDSHTSTADGAKWSSPLLAPGTTFTTDFAAAGTFAYHCEPHPGMRGSVIVE